MGSRVPQETLGARADGEWRDNREDRAAISWLRWTAVAVERRGDGHDQKPTMIRSSSGRMSCNAAVVKWVKTRREETRRSSGEMPDQIVGLAPDAAYVSHLVGG